MTSGTVSVNGTYNASGNFTINIANDELRIAELATNSTAVTSNGTVGRSSVINGVATD